MLFQKKKEMSTAGVFLQKTETSGTTAIAGTGEQNKYFVNAKEKKKKRQPLWNATEPRLQYTFDTH